MRVLITGSRGFIGQNVCEVLEEKGYEVVRYDLSEGNDVLEVNNLEHKIQQVSGVIHLAGILGTDKTVKDTNLTKKSIEVNIVGGFNVISACLKYGKRLITMDNGNHWMANPYSASKTFINQVLRSYARSRGLNADIVRAYNVYGEGQSTSQNKFAPNWITAALKNEPLIIYGSGKQQLDAIYSKDAAEIIADVFVNEKGTGQTFEAGRGTGITAQEFASLVINLTKSNSYLKFVPMRPGEEEDAIVVARNPYKENFRDLNETLLNTIDYYREWIKLEPTSKIG